MVKGTATAKGHQRQHCVYTIYNHIYRPTQDKEALMKALIQALMTFTVEAPLNGNSHTEWQTETEVKSLLL